MKKKYKTYLTMEIEGIVEAENEEDARDTLEDYIESGMPHYKGVQIKIWEVKRYWGGGNEVKDGKEQGNHA